MQAQQLGTVSMANTQTAAKAGESIAGTQRVVQTAEHWWVNHPAGEPLPGSQIPVRSTLLNDSNLDILNMWP